MKTFKVTPAGETAWVDVRADNPSDAGEEWARKHWRLDTVAIGYELDVEDPEGRLFAVSVDVDVDVSFSSYARKHPVR